MYISSIQVENYKCFRDSSEINFSPRFNVIVGKNNAGKTALIEALSLPPSSKPFLSIETHPDKRTALPNSMSEISIGLALTGQDFISMVGRFGNELFVPIAYNDMELAKTGTKQLERLIESDELKFKFRVVNNQLITAQLSPFQQVHFNNRENITAIRFNPQTQNRPPTPYPY